MNPQIVLILAFAAFVLVAYVVFEVLLFRLSCSLARVGRPSVPKSIGIVFAVMFAEIFALGALGGVVTELYIAGGYPLWEAGLVGFFLGLPVQMVVCAFLHSRMMGIKMNEGAAVWVIEKAIKFAVLIVGGLAVGLVILVTRA